MTLQHDLPEAASLPGSSHSDSPRVGRGGTDPSPDAPGASPARPQGRVRGRACWPKLAHPGSVPFSLTGAWGQELSHHCEAGAWGSSAKKSLVARIPAFWGRPARKNEGDQRQRVARTAESPDSVVSGSSSLFLFSARVGFVRRQTLPFLPSYCHLSLKKP